LKGAMSNIVQVVEDCGGTRWAKHGLVLVFVVMGLSSIHTMYPALVNGMGPEMVVN
jgi:hypothetical protein